jgi:hypothetical protein
MSGGCGAGAADQKANGLSEVDYGDFDGLSRHGKFIISESR